MNQACVTNITPQENDKETDSCQEIKRFPEIKQPIRLFAHFKQISFSPRIEQAIKLEIPTIPNHRSADQGNNEITF